MLDLVGSAPGVISQVLPYLLEQRLHMRTPSYEEFKATAFFWSSICQGL